MFVLSSMHSLGLKLFIILTFLNTFFIFFVIFLVMYLDINIYLVA
jgi:hypothetical protein